MNIVGRSIDEAEIIKFCFVVPPDKAAVCSPAATVLPMH